MLKRVLITATLILSVSFCMAETWKITSLDWQPYSGSNLANQGNSVQKLRQVLKKANIELIVEFYPWKRAQKLAGEPGYVGYFPAWPEEVSEGFIASDTVDLSELGLITSIKMKPKIKFDSVDELFRKFKIGYIKTYVYPANITAAIKKYPDNVDSAPHERSLMKKASIGRIDAGITDPNVTLFLAEQDSISNIVALDKILEVKPLVVSFRKGSDNVKRLQLLNELLKK